MLSGYNHGVDSCWYASSVLKFVVTSDLKNNEILNIGILLPKLFWSTVKKIVLVIIVIKKNLRNSRLKAKKLQNFWDHYALEQFI